MALTNKLSAIGDAIREKTGKSELLTLDAMPGEIASIETGGGGSIEVESVVLTDDCSRLCSGKMPSQYIKLFGDTVSTEDVTNANKMFQKYTNETIPFDINFKDNTSYKDMAYMFSSCNNLREIPKMTNVYPSSVNDMFSYCYMLRELPEELGNGWNMSRLNSYTYASCGRIFQYCYSLRKVPKSFTTLFENVATNTSAYCIYNNFVGNCYSLDELNDMAVNTIAYSSNLIRYLLYYCFRVKDFTFATNEDGTVKTAPWSQQTLDFTYNCGYGIDNPAYRSYVFNYNSGITADKEVYDDTTYQALKEDPDWVTFDINYSRYNHDSAVKTIQSLPILTGNNNTIKFTGAAGALTDGGAINTLTEEEIAVATAKGWTVSMS